jgi:hypothetical protein
VFDFSNSECRPNVKVRIDWHGDKLAIKAISSVSLYARRLVYKHDVYTRRRCVMRFQNRIICDRLRWALVVCFSKSSDVLDKRWNIGDTRARNPTSCVVERRTICRAGRPVPHIHSNIYVYIYIYTYSILYYCFWPRDKKWSLHICDTFEWELIVCIIYV